MVKSKVFQFDELKYYRFGLALGLANIFRNGFRLGSKKTIGKILQPINSYTRFPEYDFVGDHIERYLRQLAPPRRAKILDVGSPKCFGLYLARHFDVEIHLTDIYRPSVEEAEVLWAAISSRARGKAVFSVQDARSLHYAQEEFDIVYSMSVIEHVEGKTGDSESMLEMLRVSKPGAMLFVTVPVGQRYVEQGRIGFEGAARQTGGERQFFFQRIYTPATAEERIVSAAARQAILRRVDTVSRKTGVVSRCYRRTGINVRGLLGCFNPLLSVALNVSREGIFPARSEYGELHSGSDIYGDLMLAWEKVS